jgi:hypothetical protein
VVRSWTRVEIDPADGNELAISVRYSHRRAVRTPPCPLCVVAPDRVEGSASTSTAVATGRARAKLFRQVTLLRRIPAVGKGGSGEERCQSAHNGPVMGSAPSTLPRSFGASLS